MSPLVAVFLEAALADSDVFASNTCYCVNSFSQTPSVLSVHNVTAARMKTHAENYVSTALHSSAQTSQAGEARDRYIAQWR